MKEEAITISDMSVAYHEEPVLHDINLTVDQGDILGIIGPNGAGKTTLLRVLAGLHSLTSGSARIFGRDVSKLSTIERARSVAVVPQELSVPVALTVEELVMIGRTATLGRLSQPSQSDHEIVQRALVYVDAIDLRTRPIDELSGGEKQRAVIAMALAQQPSVILMDEVTSHLDLNHRLEIMQIVERLNDEQGVTVLMASHDLNLAAEFCKRLLILDRGRLVADGPPAEVLEERLLSDIYQCDVRVNRDAAGRLNIVPVRAAAPALSPATRIHVVAGGGSGVEILRHLCFSNYRVSAGVLNRGDTDAQTATALGIETALEKAFSAISSEALSRARKLAADADILVLSATPFGPANVDNLSVVEAALANGRLVFVLDDKLEARDYTPSLSATARIRKLIDDGAIPVTSPAALFAELSRSPSQHHAS